MAADRSLPEIVAVLAKYVAASVARPMTQSPYERGKIIECCEQISLGDADTNDFSQLAKAQKEIWRAVTFGERFLCLLHHAPNDGSGPANNDNRSFAFGTIIFMAIARLNYQMLRVLKSEESEFLNTSARDLSFCIRHNIAPTVDTLAKPILQYSVFEVITALRMICDVMIVAGYNAELMECIKLLEFRASHLIYTNGGPAVYDALDYVTKMPGGGFCCNQKFIVLIWATIYDIRRYVTLTRGLLEKDSNIDAPVVTGGEEFDYESLNVIIELTKRACSSMVAKESSPSIMKCLIKLHMRPGDAILYALDNPGASKSDEGIVGDMLGDAQFTPIARRLGTTAVNGVMDFLNVQGADFCEEPVTFGLCMVDLLDMRTQNSPGSSFGTMYAYRAVDVRGNLNGIRQKCREVPLICQTVIGGKWQLVYHDVFMFDSFMFAFLAWLKLLNLEQRKRHALRSDFYMAYSTEAYRECIEAVRRAGITVPPPDARERRARLMTTDEIREFVRSGSW